MDLDIFLDPETEEPLEYLIADGESQALNKLHVYYEAGETSTNIPNHTISWFFKFWTIETLNEAAYDLYHETYGEDVTFYDLTGEEQQNIFNTIQPDYEGTNSDTYGSITTTSTTDTDGIATSIYTSGTEAGFIEFWCEDRSIRKAKRGSFLFLWPFGIDRFGKEKLKLRVYTNLPEGAKSYLESSFNFLGSGRFEWVSQQFTTCAINEFNVINTTWACNSVQAGHYYSNVDIRVSTFVIEQNYSDYLDERAGYTASHEIGHGFGLGHLPALLMTT